jgi:dihydroflavonol-4-reductase
MNTLVFVSSNDEKEREHTMTMIERSAPVMITGATGYVAGLLVKKLLVEGLTAQARDLNTPEKLKYLNELAATNPGEIRFFKADLLDDGSYSKAMAGCELVFHTTSPFKIDVKDPRKELVDPALLGTRNVLETADRTPSVKRVALTSSCAATYGNNADLQKTPNGVFTEKIRSPSGRPGRSTKCSLVGIWP